MSTAQGGRRRFGRRCGWGELLLCLLSAGCGEGRPATHQVSGKATFEDGSPVRFGVIEFRAEGSGIIARGALNAEGEFTVGTYSAADGAVAGVHRVVLAQPLAPAAWSDANADRRLPPSAAHVHAGASPYVDPLYSDYRTSPLGARVASQGPNRVLLRVARLKGP